jgi:uncharacterized protein YdeI (YjbR/CyaY-like superfamily)
MDDFMEEIFFETRDKWRRWLEFNHDKSQGIWLVYYKKNTKIPSVAYAEAVEEALCFGWIDSKVQTIDKLTYRQIFTPRNPKSVWSETNKKRVEMMIGAGQMTRAGLEKIEAAKKNGQWENAYGKRDSVVMADDLKTALVQNPQAWENFNNFSTSSQSTYIRWISSAKRVETRENRISRVVELSSKNKKPGMT